MSAAQPSATVVKQAIQWMLRLRESGPDQRLQRKCEQWREAHPEHERAWQRVLSLHQDLDLRAIPGAGLALHTLETSERRLHRRQALKLLGGAALIGSASWLSKDLQLLTDWRSDYSTGTGERRSVTLPDGSLLQLNTRSAADLAFDARQRLIRLNHGELMLTCSDAQANGRPLLVQTHDALLEGVNARFTVRQRDDCTQVSVSAGQVALHGPGPSALHWLGSGQHWSIDAHGPRVVEQPDMDAAAWADGLIVTGNMRLADFVAEVARYRPGFLSCSDDVADLRLSGVYRLADTDALLELLPQTLPVRLHQRTRWWVRLERAA